jgi:putative acetyltransferase
MMSDARPLADLYMRSVVELGARHYSPEQIAAWASLAPAADRLDSIMGDGRTRLVAVDAEDRPLAFADLETDGHIQYLYCAPHAAGTGVAAALIEEVERAALKSGVDRLYVEASEAARSFLMKRNFNLMARRDFEIAGVAIHNYVLEKILDSDGADA